MNRKARRIESQEPLPAPNHSSTEGRVAGYRLLRRLASGDRADVYLATADGPRTEEPAASDAAQGGSPLVVLRVYDRGRWNESIAVEVEAMSSDDTGSLPALYDVAALDDGRCCLAVERVSGSPVSRLLTERSITPGEAVTLLAPIIATVAALSSRGFVHTRLSTADVVLDDRGRPRLLGLGALERLPAAHGGRGAERTALTRVGHEALAHLIEEVAAATSPRVLGGVVELLHDRLGARPFVGCEGDLERAVFEVAAPEPIAGAMVTIPPRMLARVVPPTRLETRTEGLDSGVRHEVETLPAPPRRGAISTLLSLAQLPDASGLATAADVDHVGRGLNVLRGFASARRRPLAFAGLIGGGALVLLLTLVPPATAGGTPATSSMPSRVDDDSDDPGESVAGERTVPDTAQNDGPDDGADGEAAPADPVAAAAALLERRAVCFATLDLACLDQVVQAGSAIESEDRVALIAAREGQASSLPEFDLDAVAVRAEMGAAVLLSVPLADAEQQPASLLVMRGEAGWRLRELFD